MKYTAEKMKTAEAVRKELTEMDNDQLKGIFVAGQIIQWGLMYEDISLIRANYELWKKGEIKDGAFSWHLNNLLLKLEK